MRHTVAVLALLALAAPFGAAAAARGPGDGTLSVRDLNGGIAIYAKGAVVGRCDQCLFIIDEWRGEDSINPIVSRARGVDIDGDGDKERFSGRNVKWKVIGGSFKLLVRRGTDIDISAVGKGRVTIVGSAGTYVVNGGDTIAVMTEPVTFPLRASSSP